MSSFEYRVTEDVYDGMKYGTKRIEVRLFNEKAQKINIGDTITFITLPDKDKTLNVRVTALLRYPNIFDLYDDFSKYLLAYQSMTRDELQSRIDEIFGKEEVEKHDILGIKFELID